MKKLAMMTCLKSNNVCAGVSCLDAFYGRRAAFAAYVEEELRLTAFLRCSRCQTPLKEDPGMMEKLNRILESGTETVHIGICAVERETGNVCPYMKASAQWLADRGVEIVWGTHGFFKKLPAEE